MAKKPAPTSREMLRSFRDRIARLEEEKKAIADDIKDVYGEAKSAGFDVKALRRVVKDSRMDQTQRAAQRETESITDLYRASLGMLDGTPLGDAARRRFEEDAETPRKDAAQEATEAEDVPETDSQDADANAAAAADAARELGKADYADGKSVIQNPFAANDARRADWDEGWCEASGSDGMDVPEAWRRRASSGDQPGRGA